MKQWCMMGIFCCIAFAAIAQPLSRQQEFLYPFTGRLDKKLYTLIKEAVKKGKADTAAADKLFKTAIKEARESNNIYAEGIALYEMATMYAAWGNHNRAFGGFFNARPLLTKTGTEAEQAYVLFGLAKQQYHRANLEASINHLNYTILYANRNGLKELEADALEYIARLYNEISYLGISSRELLFRSYSIKEKLNDQKGLALLLPQIAKSYEKEGKYDSALYHINESIELAKTMRVVSIIPEIQLIKAEILAKLNRADEAQSQLKYLDRSSPAANEKMFLVRYHTAAGGIYLAGGLGNEATLHYDTAIALAKKGPTPEGMAVVYNKMADAYADQHDYKKAYQYQREYNNLFVKLHVKENLGHYKFSEFMVSKNVSEEESKYLGEQNRLKQLLLEREQKLRSSLEFKNLLKDSILHQEQQLNKAIARENIYKEQQLKDERQLSATLGTTNGLQQQKLKDEKTIRILLMLALVMAALLGAVIFSQYQRQKRKGSIIQKQSDDLQTLMKEIHHRVKNNLQVISSMLDLQALSINDLHAAEAVKEGKNRVKSMALIHQYLYNEGNIKGIEMQNYIYTLAGSLFDSYNIQKGKIKFSADIDNVKLDIDTVIPIGLIMNELISNSLKYAFHEKNVGEIKVTFRKNESYLFLEVRDNGNGFASGWMNKQDSFGYKLIKAFAQKLKARIDICNNNGACVSMHIMKYKLAV
jgi:two-component system, sensor histidine kinase PdtaS